MKGFAKSIIKYALWALIFAGASYVYATGSWHEPCGTPPTCNEDAPITSTSTSQTKTGFLWTGGFGSTAGGYFATTLGVGSQANPSSLGLTALINGKVGATQYCDDTGSNCIAAANISHGSPTVTYAKINGTTGNGTKTLGSTSAFDYCALGYVDSSGDTYGICSVGVNASNNWILSTSDSHGAGPHCSAICMKVQ